jgi:hypothetical protein
VLVDDGPRGNGLPTCHNIAEELETLKRASWERTLDIAWIHYSGHGTSTRDFSGDELDGLDECIIPCDYKTGGVIIDDNIKHILSQFNPITRIICVFDCCHSGTVADLKYKFLSRYSTTIENTAPPCNPRIICISGCMDNQVSADAYNVMNMKKFSGAMTSCLILAMNMYPNKCQSDIFFLLDKILEILRSKGFEQIPQITSSKDLRDDPTFY